MGTGGSPAVAKSVDEARPPGSAKSRAAIAETAAFPTGVQFVGDGGLWVWKEQGYGKIRVRRNLRTASRWSWWSLASGACEVHCVVYAIPNWWS